MHIRAASALALILFACALDARNATASPERYYFRGGSIPASLEAGWGPERANDGSEIALAKVVDRNHRSAARVYTYLVGTVLGADDLETLVRARRWAGWSSRESPFTPLSFELARDSTIARVAVRFHYQLEDRKSRGTKRKPHIYETCGVMLVHPDTPYLLVAIEFNEWAEASVPRAAATGLDSLIARIQLIRMDPSTVRRVSTGPRPISVRPAEGALWAVCSRASQDEWTLASHAPGKEPEKTVSSELLRLDASTLGIQSSVRLEGWITDLAPSSDALWACDYRNGVLLCLDPITGATLVTLRVSKNPELMLATSEALWVTDREAGRIHVVDLKSRKLTGEPIQELQQPYSLVEAGGLLWILDQKSQTVVSLDPKTRAFVGTPIPVAEGAGYMTYGDGSLWIACKDLESIQRLDPVKRAVVATIPLGFQPSDVAFASGSLWVGGWNDGRLMAIDPATNRLQEKVVHAGLEIAMMAAGQGGVWLADGAAGAFTLMPLP